MSRSGHEESWLNIAGPPANPKYYHQTDSEPVPWGKGEKNPGEGSEIEPETYSLQSFGAVSDYRLQTTDYGEDKKGVSSVIRSR